MGKIRIVHLISSLDVGGAEMALYRLLSKMQHQLFENTVICLIEIGPIGEKIRTLGIPVYSLGMRRGQPSLLGLWHLRQWLRQKIPHVLQTWMYHADLLGLIGAKLTRTPNIIWNVRSSNLDMRQYRWLSNWTMKLCVYLSRYPQAVVVNSEAGRAFHSKIGYSPRQWVLIPNGVDLQQFRPDSSARLDVRRELGLDPEEMIIGMVARFDPRKDHFTFFAAAKQLLQNGLSSHFVLVGKDVSLENPSLLTYLDEPILDKRMHLLNRRFDVQRLMAAFDMATSSSWGEGFPNVIAEAMACSVPCVVTNVGDSASIVGDTGIVVPARDSEALAKGWRELIILGSAGRNRLGKRARERIKQHYGLEQMVKSYEELYLSLA